MFAALVEVDNSGEDRESRFRGLREELAPAMKQTPGSVSDVFASNEATANGLMVIVYAEESQARALAGAIILAAVAGGVSAVGAVATAEQFRGEARITGLALGATMATAIFGGLTPWFAQWLVERTGWSMAPGAMIALVAVSVLPVFLAMRETAPAAQARSSLPRPTP